MNDPIPHLSTESNPEPPHVIKLWHFRVLVITVILSVVGYFLFVLWGGWHDVVNALAIVGLKGSSVALILSLVNYYLRFQRWNAYLSALGYHIPFWENLRIYISGFALTTTPGKTGEALRSVFLKSHGVSYRASLGAFFAERFSDLIAVFVLSTIGLWHYAPARPLTLFVGVVLLAVIVIVQKDSWLIAIEKGAKKVFPERFFHLIEFFIHLIIAFRSCFRPKMLLIGVILGVIAWAAEGLAFYYLLHLLGTNVDMGSAQFIYAFSLLVGAVSFLPGGLGGTEVTMWQLLLRYGVSPATTVVVTVVIRLATLWFSVILGLFALMGRIKGKPEHPIG